VKHVRLVAGRELMEGFRSKAYWITIGVFVLIVAAGIVVPRLIGGDTTYEVGLAGDAPAGLVADLETITAAFDAGLEITELPDRAAATAAVEDEDVSVALVFGPDETLLVRRDQSSETLVGIANQVVALASARAVLDGAGLDDQTIVAALAPTPPTEVRVDAEQSGRLGVAWVTGLVLYLAIFMGGMSVAQGVAIEKSTRIAEVLVTSVRPAHLLAGKVVGLGLSTLFIVMAGAVPFAVAIAGGWVDVPSAAALDVLAGIGWFILGFSVYATTFGALGALVDRQEDLGAAVGPVSTVLVLSYLATIQAAGSPGSTLARVLSVFPFSAPMVMPVRIGAGSATVAEVALAVGLGVVTVAGLARLGGVIYRRALLRGGRRLGVMQVLRG
jgi:ABC-2 type transport system permease protein